MENNQNYFDFEGKTELNEELNFNRLKDCPHCKKPIPYDATFCLYCGNPIHTAHAGGKPKWFLWIAVILIILFILYSL